MKLTAEFAYDRGSVTFDVASSEGEPWALYFHGLPATRLLRPDDRATNRRGVSVVAFDRPGVGSSSFDRERSLESTARLSGALLDQLGIERFAVIGHSAGASYALACAAWLAPRVTCACLVDPPSRSALLTAARVSPLLVRPVYAGMLGLVRRSPRTFAEGLLERESAQQREPIAFGAQQAVTDSYVELARSTAAGLAFDAALVARRSDTLRVSIALPVHVFLSGRHGDSSIVPPHAQAHRYAWSGHLSLLFDAWEQILTIVAGER